MTRLSEQIAHDQIVATTVQSQIRNRRRVIRRDLTTPAVKTEAQLPNNLDVDSDLTTHNAPAALPTIIPAVQSAITVSPLDLPESEFRSGLDRRKQNRKLLMDWLRTALVDGVDFGRVHVASKDKCEHARAGRARDCTNQWHWSKPSLFKPGAEKISGMLGMTVHYPSLAGYERALLSGVQVTQVMLRCELHDAQGRIVAEGVGARNLAQDYGDMNKALKMAEKSAHIDATLRLAGLSEVFTQDIEDRPTTDQFDGPSGSSRNSIQPERAPESSSGSGQMPRPRQASSSSARPSADPDIEIIGPDDVEVVRTRIVEIGIAEKRVLSWINKVTKGAVTRFDQLNVAQCSTLLKRLDRWSEESSGQAAA